MKSPTSWQPKPRKKLKVSADGKLSYPHQFVVGQMVQYKPEFKRISLGCGIGCGIITEIQQDRIKIYWQIEGIYTIYDVAAVIFRFEVVG